MPSKSKFDASLGSLQFPKFGAGALESLKEKIQDNLTQTSSPQSKRKVETSMKKEKEDKIKSRRKASRNVGFKSQVKGSTSPLNSQSNDQEIPNQKQSLAPLREQNKKRFRNGEIKNQTPGQKGKEDVYSTRLGKKGSNTDTGTSYDIRAEIKALGGSDDDYALITGTHSESEIEGDDVDDGKISDGNLAKDLKKLVQKLAIDKFQYDTVIVDIDVNRENHYGGGQDDFVLNSNGISVPKSEETILPAVTSTRYTKKDQSQLFFQPLSEWYAAELPSLTMSSEDQKPLLSLDLMDRLHDYGKTLLESENQMYQDSQRSASSHQFYSTVMSSGTLSDKIGALTLSVQESPLHNMKALESLIGLARKRSRAQAVEVLGALKDLFGAGNLLPSNRKLRTFGNQPGLHSSFVTKDLQWTTGKPHLSPMHENHLVLWAYEDWLKSAFFQVLQIIESWCNDEVVFARGKAVDYVYTLLKEKPEQEANLLRLMINKLGDSDKKIASKTSFNILQLEATHPSMKSIIVAAIESDLIFRSGQSLHAQYYATITLNQTVLSTREEGVAKKLIDIYFALFLKLLNKPSKMEAEGPQANLPNEVKINRKGEVQGGGGAGGKRAHKKQAERERSSSTDEDLREKLLSAVLTGVNRAVPFTNTNDESFDKHLDTLFRVTHSSNFNTGIQALMLIQQLHGSNQASVDRFYRTLYESLLDPRLLNSSKQVLYLNLLFRALRSDPNFKRVKAFAKRMLQVVAMHQPSFICGVVYLLRELETVFPGLQTFVHLPEADLIDDEEVFHDVRDIGETGFPPPIQSKSSRLVGVYDGRKRDPLHADASYSTLWETQALLSHYHPSVSLFATRLLTHAPMPSKPDLGLNTLVHFLDRFVYKNPKTSAAKSTTKGVSIMQPLASADRSSVFVSAVSAKAGRERPLNSEAFWKQESEKVGADEVFFHRYFSALGRDKEKRAEKKAKKAAKRSGQEDNGEESEGNEDEDEIWQALVKSRPEIGGDDGDEEGFSDMESLVAYKDDGLDGLEDEGSEFADAVEGDDDETDPADVDMPDFDDSDVGALLPNNNETGNDLDEAFESKVRTIGQQNVKSQATFSDDNRGKRRRRLKHLPTFANVEDYEKILGGDEEGFA